jgi:RND family efflux transporter MFP subunit
MNGQTMSSRRQTTMVLALPPQAVKATKRAEAETPKAALPSTQGGSRLRKFVWLGVLLTLMGTAAYFRLQGAPEAAEDNGRSQTSIRQVIVTQPQRASSGDIVLPATVQAYQATDLFARANGFLKAWHVDIGATVKAGQVLAEIETPELDQELNQSVALLKQGQAEHRQALAELEETKAEIVLAEANVEKAQANLEFAVNQVRRSATLWSSRSISREDYEGVVRDRDVRNAELESTKADVKRRKTNLGTRQAIIESRQAIVRNREANVQRLRDLAGFQKVVAPFGGLVTRRNAEVGMLVTAGSNSGTRPLFSLAQVDILRVQAAVPQSSALGIKAGDRAQVLIPERPGQLLTAKVARTAGAVEPTSRSLLVEVELPNIDAQLLPGVYAQVRFQSPKGQASWVIPAKAVLMRSNGPHVVIVSAGGAVQMQKVTLGRDSGADVEVLVGLQGDERLILNPSDDLRDGQVVQVAQSNDSRAQSARK